MVLPRVGGPPPEPTTTPVTIAETPVTIAAELGGFGGPADLGGIGEHPSAASGPALLERDSASADLPPRARPWGWRRLRAQSRRWARRARPRQWAWSRLWLPGFVALALIALVVLLRAYLDRPFWYDEIWRGHFVSEPVGTLWSELAAANTPSALGWLSVTRLSGDLFGWHSWALRLPGFAALPALGALTAVLTRRFSGTVAALFAVCWLCLNATFLDLATQLKPYTIETLAAVAVVLLWLGPAPGSGIGFGAGGVHSGGDVRPPVRLGSVDRGRLVRRTAAGVISLFSVPAIFLVIPLAVMDVLPGPDRRRRITETLPSVVLVAAHTLLFIGHQSAQRAGGYWDTQFLAGRNPWQAVSFVAEQLWRFGTGSPPGIDQFDPSLVPGFVDLPGYLPGLLAPVIVLLGAIGAAALARRSDGRRVLGALAGAELLMLGASAARFWPFGPTRTNQFVVPMFILVVVVGGDRVIRLAARRAGRAWHAVRCSGAVPAPRTSRDPEVTDAADVTAVPDHPDSPADPLVPRVLDVGRAPAGRCVVDASGAVAVILLVVLAAGVALSGAVSGDRLVWERRDRMRGLDLMVDAAVATRRLVRPGDLVVVGGRLARPGWIYAMEVSTDAPRAPEGLPRPRVERAPGTAAGGTGAGTTSRTEPPRVVRAETVFVDPGLRDSVGRLVPLAVQLERPRRPGRLVVFVFDIDAAAMAPGLAALRDEGWCPGESWRFRLTGSVTVYSDCPKPSVASRG
ncbi:MULTISPECIES: hypothetical protein [unclassified Parafrankia]|uniref:hypothetical protein n=1 Tax=unclassified Parafrankia TaxID=2994368 RepID=UPI000DA4C4CA|nr:MULTISPECIES: hypothetical protein [unclassified Parafrankia]TCJ35382.1 hypothetical protein E0504_28100 [Parafrankia sp. BMG5.11]SQD98654.1 conserved membrane hypothetical protein [Parafrankia sp. Ea1.12]